LVYQWNVKSLHFAKNYSGTQKMNHHKMEKCFKLL